MITIIIPVYNVEKYLLVCLDSVINQSYSDYEVILVDDGSTDSSSIICDEYCQKDPRFKVIHQENMGLASARNTGIRAAKGDYLYFIDSDDCIHPELLKIMFSAAESYDANLVQVDLASVPEDFTKYNEYTIPELENWQDYCTKYDTVQSLYNLDKDDKSRGKDIRLTTTVVWTKLYRRSAFKDFLFPEGMRMHEDQMVAHRNIVRAGGMVYINIPMYFYRQSNQSLIRKGWSPKRLTILDCYDDRLRCCLEQGDQGLSNYIFKRYLVCLFRNYCVVANSMKKKESFQYRKMILTRTKSVLKAMPAKLSFKDKCLFKAFTCMPGVFAWVFKLRGK